MPFADPCVCVWACRVFTLGGGGVNRAPKNWGGGGVREKGSIDWHHSSVIMKSGAKGAENFVEH